MIKKENFLLGLLCILILGVGFVPNLGSIDKVTTQWLYLNCIGILSLFFLRFIYKIDFTIFLKNKIFRLLIFFFFFLSLSIFKAINPVESIVVLSQYFSWILIFITLNYFFSLEKNSKVFISLIFGFFLIVENIIILNSFITNYINNEIGLRSNEYLGIAANINITAYSLLYKVPFLIYLEFKLKISKYFKIILLTSILISTFFIVNTLLLTRSAMLTIFIILGFLIIIGIIHFIYSKKFSYLKISLIYLFSVVISFSLNHIVSIKNKELSSFERIQSISQNFGNNNNDQSGKQRLRYYTHAIEQILKTPILGIGLGNWKIKSIELDKENIVGYRIPYHVHNDFLELGAEIGIFGMFIYIIIYLRSLILSFEKMLKHFLNSFDELLYNSLVVAFFLIFLVDSMLNFPIARPILITIYISLIALINTLKLDEKNS